MCAVYYFRVVDVDCKEYSHHTDGRSSYPRSSSVCVGIKLKTFRSHTIPLRASTWCILCAWALIMFLHTRLEKGRERERDAGDKFFFKTQMTRKTRAACRVICVLKRGLLYWFITKEVAQQFFLFCFYDFFWSASNRLVSQPPRREKQYVQDKSVVSV